MRELLDGFVRSLPEREDNPAQAQDLNGFLCWILQRHGYQIEMWPFNFEGPRKTVSKGRPEDGVDIRAAKPNEDGTRRIYRFVLKQGNLTKSNWRPGEPNTMGADLWDAAQLPKSEDEKYSKQDESQSEVVVVAVHNGDINGDTVGDKVDTQIDRIEARTGVQVEWWDAGRLVELSLGPPEEPSRGILEEDPDPRVFSQNVQPFVRMCLDSFHLSTGNKVFEIRALEEFFQELMRSTGRKKTSRKLLRKDYVAQSLSSALLQFSMFEQNCEDVAGGNTFPALTNGEFVISFAGSLIADIDFDGYRPISPVESRLRSALQNYLDCMRRLTDRLRPLAGEDYGFSGFSGAERVNYPLRTYEISSAVALAGLAGIDLKDEGAVERSVQFLELVVSGNLLGLSRVVAEDQVVDLSVILAFLRVVGEESLANEICLGVVDSFLGKFEVGHEMPSTAAVLRKPIGARDAFEVVRQKFFPTSEHDAHASLVLTLCMYQLFDSGVQDLSRRFKKFLGEVSWQLWHPPDDWSSAMFERYLGDEGCTTLLSPQNLGQFAQQFRDSLEQVDESRCAEMGFPSVEAFAAKRWRNPLPCSHVFSD